MQTGISRYYDAKGNCTCIKSRFKTILWSYEYDSHNNIIKSKCVDNSNGVGYETLFTYEYDTNGRITRKTSAKSDGTDIDEVSYTYDENGNVLTRTNAFGTVTYTYDAHNNVVSKITTNGDDALIEHFTYEYDENGNVLSVSPYTEDDTAESRSTIYAYDSHNNVIRKNDNLFIYEYSEDGRILSKQTDRVVFDDNGDITSRKTITKEVNIYDKHNNLIEKDFINGNKNFYEI